MNSYKLPQKIKTAAAIGAAVACLTLGTSKLKGQETPYTSLTLTSKPAATFNLNGKDTTIDHPVFATKVAFAPIADNPYKSPKAYLTKSDQVTKVSFGDAVIDTYESVTKNGYYRLQDPTNADSTIEFMRGFGVNYVCGPAPSWNARAKIYLDPKAQAPGANPNITITLDYIDATTMPEGDTANFIQLPTQFDGSKYAFSGIERWIRTKTNGVSSNTKVDSNLTQYVKDGYRYQLTTDSTLVISTVETVVGVEEPKAPNTQVKVYPNPVQSDLNIERAGEGRATLVITDALGGTVYRSLVEAGEKNIALPFGEAPAGTYFVRFIGTDGRVERQKFVKE